MEKETIQEIVNDVEQRLQFTFFPEEIEALYQYTLRKAQMNGKDADYVPILFENELEDAVMRYAITCRGELNVCCKIGC